MAIIKSCDAAIPLKTVAVTSDLSHNPPLTHHHIDLSGKDRMVRISDLVETRDSVPQASSSKMNTVDGTSCCQGVRQSGPLSVRSTDGDNAQTNSAFDKLPPELLVEIFKHARTDGIRDVYVQKYPTPLTQVCRYWRSVALDAPTLWSNIYIMKHYTEETREAAHINLERSKICPLFLTWFSNQWQFTAEAQEVIDDLIIPYANRWQRITLIASGEEVADALVAAMGPLDFEILQDLEISRLSPRASGLTLCRSAPLLRRCRLSHVPSLPPLPLNLVVLDCEFTIPGSEPFNLDPWLEFLPHVAHSLEHLRFGPPASDVSVTPRESRVTLPNLKSLLVRDSHCIMDHILTPNLTYFAAFHPFEPDARKVAEMFHGFFAPKLQSVRFGQTPLLPLLTSQDLPSMFPELETVVFEGCDDESAFINLLEPPQPPSVRRATKYPPKHQNVENPFPKLKELAISELANWTSLQAAIENRRKNGDKTFRTVHLPKEGVIGNLMQYLTRWLPKQGVKLALYEPGELVASTPPGFQDDFCNEEFRLFHEIVDERPWDGEEDEDFEIWQERFMDRLNFQLPNDY